MWSNFLHLGNLFIGTSHQALFLNPMFVFFKIAPQLVCIVTDNLSTTSVYQLGSPLSRCLTHIDHLYWERTTYYFLPMKTQVLKKKKKKERKLRYCGPKCYSPMLSVSNISFSLESLYSIL